MYYKIPVIANPARVIATTFLEGVSSMGFLQLTEDLQKPILEPQLTQ